MRIDKFLRSIKKTRNLSFVFKLPKKCEILIIDTPGSSLIADLCGTRSHEVLNFEKLNILILLKTILHGHWSMIQYQNLFIESCEPKVIVTFIDNEMYFYSIKSTFPHIYTIAVQNGLRANYSSKIGDGFFTKLRRLHSPSCDYYFAFNDAFGNYIRKFLNTKVITAGSLRNNAVLVNQRSSIRKKITFISQLAPRVIRDDLDGNFFDNLFVSDLHFYAVEIQVTTFLSKFCQEEDLEFIICGKRSESSKFESFFFKEALLNRNTTFCPRISEFSTYDLMDKSDIVVSIDSAAGYESISRGKRTAFFSIRGESISNHLGTKIDELNFGWPMDLPESGTFWTNHADEAEFTRILNYLLTVSDTDWSNEARKYTKDLMVFDPGNTLLRDLLQRLGADLNK